MSQPNVPDPNAAAVAGARQSVANYPFEYLINALAQTGGSETVNGTNYDFSGLGNADVQNAMSSQMADTLLAIQQNLGPQFIAQRLQDLQQADPEGYASRQQLFDKIMADAQAAPPNGQLSNDTQTAIMNELQKGTSLDPTELQQVQQGVRGGQLDRGVYLGNAAQQQEADAVVNAGDQAQAGRQAAANQFLQSGVSPSDIEYRKLQQDMANLGSFLSNTTPTAQFGSLSGAQNQAAPNPNTGYSPYTLDPNAAAQGVSNAYNLYGIQSNYANNQVNPYLAGLSTATGVANTAFNLGYSPWASPSAPAPSYAPQSLPGWDASNPAQYAAGDYVPNYGGG